MTYFALCIGGIIGGSLRYFLESLSPHAHVFPTCTLLINLCGSFILGAFYGLADVRHVAPWLRIGFGTGVIGSFTTFSTFCLDSTQLASSHLLFCALYISISLIGGPLLAYLGDRMLVGLLSRSISSELSV